MAGFLPRRLAPRLPSRAWELGNGQRVHVRFEPTTAPTIKFVWREPHTGPEGIHVARLSLLDFGARINGAVDQGDEVVSVFAPANHSNERACVHLPLPVAWHIKKAADQQFVNLRR